MGVRDTLMKVLCAELSLILVITVFLPIISSGTAIPPCFPPPDWPIDREYICDPPDDTTPSPDPSLPPNPVDEGDDTSDIAGPIDYGDGPIPDSFITELIYADYKIINEIIGRAVAWEPESISPYWGTGHIGSATFDFGTILPGVEPTTAIKTVQKDLVLNENQCLKMTADGGFLNYLEVAVLYVNDYDTASTLPSGIFNDGEGIVNCGKENSIFYGFPTERTYSLIWDEDDNGVYEISWTDWYYEDTIPGLPAGGSPFVFTNDSEIPVNNILPQSEHAPLMQMVEDCLHIGNLDTSWDNTIRIRELENEITSLDSVFLEKYEINPDMTQCQNNQNDIVQFSSDNLISPDSALNMIGWDILEDIQFVNDGWFTEGLNGDSFQIEFSNLDTDRDYHLLLKEGSVFDPDNSAYTWDDLNNSNPDGYLPPYVKMSLFPSVVNEGVYTELGTISPRMHDTYSVIPIGNDLVSSDMTIQINYSNYHTIDFVSLVSGVETCEKVGIVSPDVVYLNSIENSKLSEITIRDNSSTLIMDGDVLYLEYPVNQFSNNGKYTYALKTSGWYIKRSEGIPYLLTSSLRYDEVNKKLSSTINSINTCIKEKSSGIFDKMNLVHARKDINNAIRYLDNYQVTLAYTLIDEAILHLESCDDEEIISIRNLLRNSRAYDLNVETLLENEVDFSEVTVSINGGWPFAMSSDGNRLFFPEPGIYNVVITSSVIIEGTNYLSSYQQNLYVP